MFQFCKMSGATGRTSWEAAEGERRVETKTRRGEKNNRKDASENGMMQ
jgi:hypothetical protein